MVDTEGRVTAGNGRHDRGIVTDVPDVKGTHASALSLHGVGMEAGCIQDGRRATEQEAVHRKAIVQEVVLPGEKEGHHIGLKEDGQKAWELEEEEEHYLRSRSLKHPLCQSLEQSPWACQTPWASRPPWACRRQ